MARPTLLDDSELSAAVADLPGWEVVDRRLHREMRFRDFATAFAFMAASATAAEKLDHHPDWSNVWATVVVDLSTHDAGGITALDVALARRMSALAEPLLA